MAVITEFPVVVREFSGFDDPRYPSGYWAAAGVVIGDATGGTMTAQLNYARATELRNSQYYSLEQFQAWRDFENAEVGQLAFSNFQGPSTNRFFGVAFVATAVGLSLILGGDLLPLQPLWLGRQADPNTSSALALILTNTDTVVVNVRAEGYIWGPRSVAVPGGPQRPPTGLYRS